MNGVVAWDQFHKPRARNSDDEAFREQETSKVSGEDRLNCMGMHPLKAAERMELSSILVKLRRLKPRSAIFCGAHVGPSARKHRARGSRSSGSAQRARIPCWSFRWQFRTEDRSRRHELPAGQRTPCRWRGGAANPFKLGIASMSRDDHAARARTSSPRGPIPPWILRGTPLACDRAS